MPIRAEFRHFYGREWRTVTRPRILKRAGNCCEQCGVPNRTNVMRACGWWAELIPLWYTVRVDQAITTLWIPANGNKGHRAGFPRISIREVHIILTIAHLNHIAGDDRDENLKALCQWCHLNYDKLHHHLTRAARKDAARPLLTPQLPAKEASL